MLSLKHGTECSLAPCPDAPTKYLSGLTGSPDEQVGGVQQNFGLGFLKSPHVSLSLSPLLPYPLPEMNFAESLPKMSCCFWGAISLLPSRSRFHLCISLPLLPLPVTMVKNSRSSSDLKEDSRSPLAQSTSSRIISPLTLIIPRRRQTSR